MGLGLASSAGPPLLFLGDLMKLTRRQTIKELRTLPKDLHGVKLVMAVSMPAGLDKDGKQIVLAAGEDVTEQARHWDTLRTHLKRGAVKAVPALDYRLITPMPKVPTLDEVKARGYLCTRVAQVIVDYEQAKMDAGAAPYGKKMTAEQWDEENDGPVPPPPKVPTIAQVLRAGYPEGAAAGIVAHQQAMFDAGVDPYGDLTEEDWEKEKAHLTAVAAGVTQKVADGQASPLQEGDASPGAAGDAPETPPAAVVADAEPAPSAETATAVEPAPSAAPLSQEAKSALSALTAQDTVKHITAALVSHGVTITGTPNKSALLMLRDDYLATHG